MPEDDYGGLAGRFYGAYIERPRLARVIIRALWGGDARPMYRSLERLGELSAGVTVLDAACGSGLALRWLEPARVGRYVGIDASPAMLDRARERARRRGFPDARLVTGDIARIPMDDAEADVCLLYNALHVVPNPQAAVAEARRCLRPGGRLEGSMILRGARRRVDRLFEREERRPSGLLGPGGTRADLLRWLEGFAGVEIEAGGSLATFRARRP